MNNNWLKALLQSRKFWLTFILAVSGLVLYVQGAIPADQFANLLTALGVVLVAAIAGEDFAAKINKPKE